MYIDFLKNELNEDVVFENNVKLASSAKIMNCDLYGNLFLGMSSCINRSELGRYIGIAYFSYLADLTTGNYCTFGSRVSIGAFSHPIDELTIHEVGYRNTTASYGETVYERDSEAYLQARNVKTKIGHDVWVGDNSVIIKGVEIGSGAIVAAGSVVTKDVEPYSIVAGNPAKKIKMRVPEAIADKIQATKWWERSMEELKDIPFNDIDKALDLL